MATKKGSYHHGNLREALLEIAHTLIESEGVKAITLRRIAKEAGVSQNAPYSHFADKAALLDALAVDGFKDLIACMMKASKSAMTPADHLQAIGTGYVNYALSHPELFHLMFNLRQSEKPASTALQEASSKSFQILRNAVINVQEAESPDREGSLIATISAWSIVHGLSVLIIENKLANNPDIKKLSRKKIIDQTTKIFTQGLINFQK